MALLGALDSMKKATITPLKEDGSKISGDDGEAISVLFNPSEYSIEKSNQFQSTAMPGLSTPITHFINGNATTLTMELFFDTYLKREDVRKYTGRIAKLLDINGDLHAPPLCEFSWGELIFRAVLERMTQKFTMFLDSGIPVRATLNVTFKEYKTITEQLKQEPRKSSDRTKHRVIQEGDTLWLIAGREYGDPGLWRMIARANNIDNPRRMEAGKEIIVPPLE